MFCTRHAKSGCALGTEVPEGSKKKNVLVAEVLGAESLEYIQGLFKRRVKVTVVYFSCPDC